MLICTQMGEKNGVDWGEYGRGVGRVETVIRICGILKIYFQLKND